MKRAPTNTQAPLCLLGDIVRLVRTGEWRLPEGGHAVVPAGTEGRVMPWHTPEWGNACAILFEGYTHPISRWYPMALTRPGVDGYPSNYELVRRPGAAAATDLPTPPLPEAA